MKYSFIFFLGLKGIRPIKQLIYHKNKSIKCSRNEHLLFTIQSGLIKLNFDELLLSIAPLNTSNYNVILEQIR